MKEEIENIIKIELVPRAKKLFGEGKQPTGKFMESMHCQTKNCYSYLQKWTEQSEWDDWKKKEKFCRTCGTRITFSSNELYNEDPWRQELINLIQDIICN